MASRRHADLQAVVAGETVEVSDQQVAGDVCEMVLGHLSEGAEHQQRGGGVRGEEEPPSQVLRKS